MRMLSIVTCVLLTTLILLPAVCLAQAGVLDPSFGTDGLVTTDFNRVDMGTAVGVQPDGKIVMAGFSTGSIGAPGDFALARYNKDGSLDTGFGTDGQAIIDFGSNDTPEALEIRSNGQIVVVGRSGSPDPSGPSKFALAQYNKDGSLDTGFGTGGLVTTEFGSWSQAWAVTVQPNGQIVVAGHTCGNALPCNNSDVDIVLARYNKDGSLDTGFGTDGFVTTDFFGFDDRATAVALRPDGKIVVGATAMATDASIFRPAPRHIALAQYNRDGSPDTGFGPNDNGRVTTPFPDGTASMFVEAISIQPGGKIVVAGPGSMQYNKDGSLDMGFGTKGHVITNVFSNGHTRYIAVQDNDKIVSLGGADFVLARYNKDGSIDTEFGTDGIAETSVGGFGLVLTIQRDGRILAAGMKYACCPGGDFALVRYSGH